MYNRFAKDLSKSLFDSVYGDLYALAERENKSIYTSTKKKKKRQNVYHGESQEKLNDFCYNKLSLGAALDFIKIEKAYQ